MIVKELKTVDANALLDHIKKNNNIEGTYQDAALRGHIDEVKCYLLSAGVLEEVVNSTVAIGCISRGVMDLWNYGNGDTKLSEYFYQRAAQLRYVVNKEN